MPPRQSPAQKLAAKLLLGGEWAPVTNTIGFLQRPLDEAVIEWRQWAQESHYQPAPGFGITEYRGTLRELLGKLLPLGYGQRWLLLETTNPEWTAVMENTHDTSSRGPIGEHFAAARGLTTVQVEDVPKNIKRMPDEPARGRWGSRNLTVYNENGFRRGLSLEDFEPWRFSENGEPYDLEDTEQYSLPRPLDCFPHETLVDICRNLGLDPFEEDFYVPNGRGFIIESLHEPAGDEPWAKRYTLAEARAGYEDLERPRVDDPVLGNALYSLGSANPNPDVVYPSLGYQPFRKPTPWDEALKEFEKSVQRYASYPASASLSVGLEEYGVLASPTYATGGTGSESISVSVTPPLLEAPPEVQEYTAAYSVLQWTQANGRSVREFYPNRKQMTVIRNLYKDNDLYPFDVTSTQVYATLAIDKMIRDVTDLRITQQLVDWETQLAAREPAEKTNEYDERNNSCAWEIRKVIQDQEHLIWNTQIDGRQH
ncbi:hypothetical protein [Paenarthrobacter ilicis]|uniref:Uncharacterized protein n=1 Tax=Paenarthrobacter ilicis TaxID=43665 RepID=A0ABX0THG9_9MICC|nr:hypothetical protein [Paenarthrobacter ilicis]MBM7792277.1 hypothetical protein [Paenarthrobacter ilicis]NIJ00621.1 hypothetical protein [Paenarthrobacter ilicis]